MAENTDLGFIDLMLMHHESGVQMAQMAAKKAADREVADFAERSVKEQKKDSEKLRRMRDDYFAGEPKADSMTVSGSRMTATQMMQQSETDMSKLQAASGKEFDKTFLKIFSEHHQMAIDMSEEESSKGTETEIIKMADETIAKQTKEIEEMQSLRQDLSSAADSSR